MDSVLNFFTAVLNFFTKFFVTPKDQVKKIVTIYDTMHYILEETPIERFLIFKAHNGGGVIKPNTPIYTSVLYEDYTHPFRSVKEQYQRLETDEHYLRLLVELITKKFLIVKTEDLPQSNLKTVYEGEGVKYSEIYFLGNDRKNIYYCSCATSVDHGWEDNPYQKNQIYLAINKIKQNIK